MIADKGVKTVSEVSTRITTKFFQHPLGKLVPFNTTAASNR